MSADNGYEVVECCDLQGYYGIFYYYASAEHSENFYTIEKSMATYASPVTAIIAAHDLETQNPTEYGVHVSSEVSKRASKEVGLIRI